MRILMVHPHDMESNLEPWTVRIAYFARELTEAGHQVRLVHHGRPAPGGAEGAPSANKYPFEVFGFPRVMVSMHWRCHHLSGLAHWADVVHFQKCLHYSSLPAVFAAYYHGRPLHYDWDDWEQKIYEMDRHSRIGSWIFFRQMERHLLKLADTVSVASEGLRVLALRNGFPEDRIFLAPVGAAPDVFSPSVDGGSVRKSWGAREHVVLYQGQISGANYVHRFLESAKSVCAGRSDSTFVIVGGGDRLEQAKEYARELGLEGHLLFVGEVPHTEVPRYIAAADVVVASFLDNEQSRCKSPLKVAEYMASGKAIVASRVGEVPRMVGDAGLLVDPENHESMAAAINTLLDDPPLREKLGRMARERAVGRFTWRHSTFSLIEAYEKAIRTRYGIGQNP